MRFHSPLAALAVSALAVAAGLTTAPTLEAQQAVPVRELSAPDAKTTDVFGNIFNVRPLTDGRVLVNDGVRRQLVTLDQNFGNRTVLIDSVTTGGQGYGPRAAPLIPYLADSSLFVDTPSLSLLVIDPKGKVARVMSAPKAGDLRFLGGSASGTDKDGNLVYRGMQAMQMRTSPNPGQVMTPPTPPDSAPIVRGNFETRTVDTVGRVKMQADARGTMTQDGNGKTVLKMILNPVSTVDEWAVLSDGTIAFVRGHDYHVDLIKPDGTKFSTAKLPFDWKRLTDEDKQALIDSARTAREKQMADAKAAASANPAAGAADRMGAVAAMAGGGGGGTMTIEVHRTAGGDMGGGGRGGDMVFAGPGGPGGMGGMPTTTLEFVPLKEIADYYPAIRAGAAKPDLDGNLWILTTTTAQSKAGELVYDVLNNQGELFQRVRLPLGRSIAGFGHKGIVYLMYREGTLGWHLERTHILSGARATDDR